MQASLPNRSRPWRVIAHEITHAMDPKKVRQLSDELDRALAQQGLKRNRAGRSENDKK